LWHRPPRLTVSSRGVFRLSGDQVGYANFVEALSEGQDLSLIGQFGVGFADRVGRMTRWRIDSNDYVQHTKGGTVVAS
jgi:hypothetical protein